LTGKERIGDEELRRRQAEILDETMRLLRADAQIMETIRDMVGVARGGSCATTVRLLSAATRRGGR
jgi:hypothetical protein